MGKPLNRWRVRKTGPQPVHGSFRNGTIGDGAERCFDPSLEILLDPPVDALEAPSGAITDFPVDDRREHKPARLDGQDFFEKRPTVFGTQDDGHVETAKRAVVIDATHLVLASLDPLKRMFVPTETPTHVTQLTDLMRSAVLVGHVVELPFRKACRLIQPAGIGDVAPETVGFHLEM